MFSALKKTAVCLSAFLSALVFGLQPADGYLLQGPHVLELMLESINLPHRLLINQKVILFDPDGNAQSAGFDQLLRYHLPERFRSDIETPELKRIYIASADASLTVLDGRVVSETDHWMDHYKDIFFYRSRERLETRLRETGIDVSVTSLGRFDGKIALVIGAQYPNESSPQLWVEKEGFLPLRWLFRPGDSASGMASLEIRYSEWRRHSQAWYPIRIDFLEGGALVRRIQVEGMELNPGLSEAVFDLERIRKSCVHESGNTSSEPERSDVEKKIDEFRRIFE